MSSAAMTLAPEPTSARAARKFVVQELHSAGREGQADIAEVLVSELVTNAILHARTPIKIEVRVSANVIRISVTDGVRAGVRRRDYAADATTGRGIAMVEALASDWGSGPSNGGKTVWFELRESAMAT